MVTTAIPMAEMYGAARLRLWQLISPALPVGAYAYSQGQEYAVQCGWVRDEATAAAWITGQVTHSLAALDIPVLARLYAAWQEGDMAALRRWCRFLLAARESAELLAEDRHLGASLARILADLDVTEAKAWQGDKDASFAAMFALAATRWGIPLREAAEGYLWAWCENQVAAAIKLVPLGQTAGQRMVSRVIPCIQDAVERGLRAEDDDIGATAPGVGIASALHETQYTRLFRS